MNELSLRNLPTSVPAMLVGLMSLFLVFWKSPHQGFGDDGIYVEAGNRLISGLPVYIDGFRGGQVGALSLFLLSEILFGGLAWAIFQFISVGSIVGSVLLITSKYDLNTRLFISFFAISSAPTREMLHNHQITALVIFLSLWPFFYTSNVFFVKAMQVLGAAMAIDLKPQISLVLVFSIALSCAKLKIFFMSISLLLISHLSLNLWRGENIDAQWINTITEVGGSSKWGESIHIWPLFENWGINDSLLMSCAYFTILVLLVVILWFAIKGKAHHVLLYAGFLTYFLTYSHFYDCILIAVLACIQVIKKPNRRNLLFMSFGLVPGFLFVPRNFVFWVIMLMIFLLFMNYFTQIKFREIASVVLFTLFIHFAFTQFTLDFNQEVRARSAIYVLLFMLTLVDYHRLKTLSKRSSV